MPGSNGLFGTLLPFPYRKDPTSRTIGKKGVSVVPPLKRVQQCICQSYNLLKKGIFQEVIEIKTEPEVPIQRETENAVKKWRSNAHLPVFFFHPSSCHPNSGKHGHRVSLSPARSGIFWPWIRINKFRCNQVRRFTKAPCRVDLRNGNREFRYDTGTEKTILIAGSRKTKEL